MYDSILQQGLCQQHSLIVISDFLLVHHPRHKLLPCEAFGIGPEPCLVIPHHSIPCHVEVNFLSFVQRQGSVVLGDACCLTCVQRGIQIYIREVEPDKAREEGEQHFYGFI